MADTHDVIEMEGRWVAAPTDDLIRFTHIIYALHAASLVIGITTSVTIVGAFLFGIPSIVAVVLNYAKKGAVRGSFLESHFSWQIRTFWYALLWVLIGVAVALTIIGLPVALLIWGVLTLWVIYRIVRGWLALRDRRALPV